MKHYFNKIKILDKNNALPHEICEALGFKPELWYEVWAAAVIYIQDGGRRYNAEDFISAINPDTPSEVEGCFQKFYSSMLKI
jgi:hypothetical protein